MKKERKKIAIGVILIWVSSVIYMAALAFLVPFISLLLAPPTFFMLPPGLGKLTFIAIALVIASGVILTFYKKSVGNALQYLGYMTFLVAGIAVFFAFVGKEKIISLLSVLGSLKPVAAGYVQYWAYFVPKVWLSIAIYVAVGIILWVIGNRLKRREQALGYVKKVYGRRARIIR